MEVSITCLFSFFLLKLVSGCDIFNDRWKANHNTKQVSDYKEAMNRINNKMFGSYTNFNNKQETKEDKVNNLNRQIQGNKEINRNNKINSIINNFRK